MVGSIVGSYVGSSVGSNVGSNVGSMVGSNVGSYVGTNEGYKLRSYVLPKFENLKQELINNTICHIVLEQFVSEYAKAMMHLHSFYGKKNFKGMKIEHMLSVMIHCNFDTLQCYFNKTYRENQGKDHCNFYWMGLYLKTAVHEYGTRICRGSITSFYHGFSKQLIFPEYITTAVGHGVSIHCPLSTSSSQTVAIKFADQNQGLVVELTGMNATYFPCKWISDFGYESEYLFVQNSDAIKEHLKIENIINCRTLYECKHVLDALVHIMRVFSGWTKNDEHVPHDDMNAIIQKRLGNNLSGILKNDKTDLELIQRICDKFFNAKKEITLNIEMLGKYNKYIYDELFEGKVLNEQVIKQLFPNVSKE
eukprot:238121_1